MFELREFLSRQALVPSLRLMRDRLAVRPDYQDLRKWGARFDRAYPKTPHEARVTEVAIGDVKALWIGAKGARKNRVILYLHGGAFVMETPSLHSSLVARIAKEARARALMPSYRLAPEHPFPAALDDCMSAYRFLLDSGFRPADIVVAGDSAGGNLTLALLLRVRDEGLPLPAGAVAMSPLTDATFGGDSIRRNEGHDAMFAPALFFALAPLYVPDEKLRENPYASPLMGDLDGLPPILILVGSTELLLDDSVRFASRCPSATLEVWHDMPHVFPSFEFLPEAVDATERMGRFMRECFSAAHAAKTANGVEEALADRAGADEDATEGEVEVAGDAKARAIVSRHVTSASLSPLAWVYLALAIVAAIAAIAPLIPTFAAFGGAPQGLLAWLWAGAGSGRAGVNIWVGTAALLIFAVSSVSSIGWRRVWLPVLATLLLGLACGLALLLFERQRSNT